MMLSRVTLANLKLQLKVSLRNRLLLLPSWKHSNANSCAVFIGRGTTFPFSTSTDMDPIAKLDGATTTTGEPYAYVDFPEYGASHILVKSLLQVFCISVHPHGLDKGSTSNIYGCVRVNQGQGHDSTFTLYDRDAANPETLLEQGNLSLIGPSSTHVSGTTPTSMDFFLKDTTRDITIINTRHYLDSEIDSSYDKLRKDIIQGDHGFASVWYVTWRFAYFATVEIAILEKYDTKNPFSQVYGTIVAGYAKIKRRLKNDDGLENMRSILFSKPSDQAVWTTVAEPLCLSTSVVAVPPYASLEVQVQLWDAYGQLASGSVQFIDDYWGTKTIKGDGGVVSVKLMSKTESAFSDIYKKKELGNHMQSFFGREEMSESKDFPMPSAEQLPSAITSLRSTHSSANKAFYDSGKKLVEIFSIIVSGFTHEVSALCGKIEVYAGCLYPRIIYERHFSNPEFLSDDRSMVTLEGPCNVDCHAFDAILNLKDPVSDLEICDGCIPWGPPRWGCSDPFHDTRLCSLIQGANGYGAVYYTFFSSAFKAVLEITILCKDGETVSGNIYGCVRARYSNHDYSSTHDKQYYQSILFDKPQVESMKLTRWSNIPLSKYSVAVPSDSSLIVDANLRLECIDNQNHGVVSGAVEFEADLSNKILKEIQGDHYFLLVTVKFYN